MHYVSGAVHVSDLRLLWSDLCSVLRSSCSVDLFGSMSEAQDVLLLIAVITRLGFKLTNIKVIFHEKKSISSRQLEG